MRRKTRARYEMGITILVLIVATTFVFMTFWSPN